MKGRFKITMNNLKPFAALSLLAFASLSIAQQKALYTPIRGVKEFNGQMIVRPLQVTVMMDKGLPLDQISNIRTTSVNAIRPNIIRYIPETDEYVIRVPIGSNENTYGKLLIDSGNYQYVTPNWLCYPVATPSDPLYPQQWHHRVIQSPQAWNLWTGAPNFTTAFVDSGILKTHEDLKNLLVPGYNSEDKKTEAEGGEHQ
jgi:hypothetical protein